jgi:endoglucanase
MSVSLACLAQPVRGAPALEWDAFKARFLQSDGRIVDTGNGGISHTEGQGWGLLFAVTFDDPVAFASILDWTTRTLRRSGDALHSWRYVPDAGGSVPDTNNATDGDLFIGMALSRAARRWARPEYATAAVAITHDVLRLLVRRVGTRTVLMPGVEGFSTERTHTLNPSYYAFPALQELATRTRDPLWRAMQLDGLALIHDGRFGQWMLPPDWLQISRKDGSLEIAEGWPPRFSYDAIRVPLYLAWARQMLPPVEQAFRTYWAQKAPAVPAWVDLASGAVAPYPAPPGMRAVAEVSGVGSTVLDLPAGFPALDSASDYYSAALIVLSRIAWQESRRLS